MHSAKSTRLGAASRSHRIRIDTLSAALLALILLATALPHPLLAQSGTDHQWRIFERGEGLTSNDISTVFTDGNVVWVGTDAGIARYDGAWTSYPHSRTDDAGPGLSSGLPAGAVAVISHGEAPGELWAATGRGYVSSWDGKHWRYRFSMTDEVLDLLMFDGNLYVAGAQGLEIFDSEKETTSAVSVFEGQAVHTLAIHQDALWAGGDSGLWQLKGQEWQHIAVPDWLDTAVVTSLWSDSANRIWVGTNLGVMYYDVPTEAWSGSYLPILNEREEVTPIRAVVGDAAGAIWAISEVGGGGARKFISEGIITIDVSRTSGGGLSTPFVRDIAIGDDGAIWFATPIGLFQYLEGYWQNEYIVREGMDRRLNAVNELLIDRAGDLWIATAGAGVRRKTEVLIG